MIPVQITYPDPLFEAIPTNEILSRSLPELRAAPLVSVTSRNGLPLISSQKGQATRTVRTLNEFYQAEDEGFFAATTVDMIEWSRFRLVADLLSAVMIARPASVSYLRPLSEVALIPANLFPMEEVGYNVESSQLELDPAATIESMEQAGKYKIVTREPGRLGVQNGVATMFTEVLIGDLDGDGVQDMLVWKSTKIVDGSLRWSSSLALTRVSNDALFSKVRLPFQ